VPHNEPLARLERDLRMPPQRRLELLEEIDADLDALFRELVARGLSPARARQVALSRLLPEGEALEHLEAEHEPIGARWLRRRSWHAYAERGALVLAAGIPAVLALWTVRRAGGATTGSLWIAAELLIVAALGVNWVRTASLLWVRRDLRPVARLAHWRLQVGLIVAAVAIGALGGAWEGYRLLNVGAVGAPITVPAWTIMRSALTLAILGTAAAIFGLFGWLSLMPRLATDDIIDKRIAEVFRRSGPTLDPTRR